jgi:hypothetical protein
MRATATRLEALEGQVALISGCDRSHRDARTICLFGDKLITAGTIKRWHRGERGQIHARVMGPSPACPLKAEHGAVELGGDLSVVHDDVDAGNGLNISSWGKVRHCSLSTKDLRLD